MGYDDALAGSDTSPLKQYLLFQGKKDFEIMKFLSPALLLFSSVVCLCTASPVEKTVWTTYVSWGPLNGTWTGHAHPDPVELNASGDAVRDFRTEITHARQTGINGFLFDLTLPQGRKSFLRYYVLDSMLKAAEGTDFFINPMFDLISPNPELEADALTEFYRKYADHPNILKNGRKILIFGYHMNRRNPEYWKKVFELCRKNGAEFESYFEFRDNNTNPNCSKISAAQVEPFLKMPEFAGAYNFYQIKHIGCYLKAMKQAAQKYGKRFGGNLQVGYIGDLRSWRSDWYWPFFHSGVLRESGDAILRENPDFLHITTWNDYQETEIRPTIWQQDCESRIIRSYINLWRTGTHLRETNLPELILSIRREILAGEILKVEYVNLPSGFGKFQAKIKLYDAESGTLLAEGNGKEINAKNRSVGEWRFDSGEWDGENYPAAVRPELELTRSGRSRAYTLPSVVLRHGRLENMVTTMTAVPNIPEPCDFSLQLARKDDHLKCSLHFKGQKALKHLQLLFDGSIFHSVSQEELAGKTKLSLQTNQLPPSRWNGLKIRVENGIIGRVSRRFNHFNKAFPEFSRTTNTLSLQNLAEGMTNLEIIGDDTTLIHATSGKFQGRAALGELRSRGKRLVLKNPEGKEGVDLINTGTDVFPANRPELNQREISLEFTIPTPSPIRSNSMIDVFLVYEDGTREIKGPFFIDPAKKKVEIPLFASREEFDEAYHHFTVNPPSKTARVKTVRVPENVLQYDCFDFSKNPDSKGNFLSSGTRTIPAVPGGTSWRGHVKEHEPRQTTENGETFLRFDGKGDYLICGVRSVFSGACTVEMKVRPVERGRKQVLFCNGRDRTGYRNLHLSLDEKGYLLLEREEPDSLLPESRRSFWRKHEFKMIRLKSRCPLPLNVWTEIRAVFDFRTLALYIDGNLQEKCSVKPYLIRGNSMICLGSAHGNGDEISSRAPGKNPFRGDIALFRYCGWPEK